MYEIIIIILFIILIGTYWYTIHLNYNIYVSKRNCNKYDNNHKRMTHKHAKNSKKIKKSKSLSKHNYNYDHDTNINDAKSINNIENTLSDLDSSV